YVATTGPTYLAAEFLDLW
nr:immunoglobulin heavy chain junction region [Macaca mulatta]